MRTRNAPRAPIERGRLRSWWCGWCISQRRRELGPAAPWLNGTAGRRGLELGGFSWRSGRSVGLKLLGSSFGIEHSVATTSFCVYSPAGVRLLPVQGTLIALYLSLTALQCAPPKRRRPSWPLVYATRCAALSSAPRRRARARDGRRRRSA